MIECMYVYMQCLHVAVFQMTGHNNQYMYKLHLPEYLVEPLYPHSQPAPCVHSVQCMPRCPLKLNGSTLDLL